MSGEPTPSKIYYDFLSWFATQFTLCFITAPFLILSFQDSLLVWARVYFYAVFGIVGMTAFFASPAKSYLKKQIEARAAKANGGKAVKESVSTDVQSQQPVLGLPPDPEGDFEEVVREIRDEIEMRHRKGLKKTQTMPLPATKGI